MDDYNIDMLYQSGNRWAMEIISVLTPLMVEGIKSQFLDAYKLCVETEQEEKYLMTFQTFLKRVHKWNDTIVENETKRIIEKSKCKEFELLISAVHINHLKILSSVRVSQKQKAVPINIANPNQFVHRCYINFARKIYENTYLFQYAHNPDMNPLQFQRDMRECELICRESIMKTIRENMPIEEILRAYMDETEVEEVIEEVIEKIDDTPVEEEKVEEKKDVIEAVEPGSDIIKIQKPEMSKIEEEKINVSPIVEKENGPITDVTSYNSSIMSIPTEKSVQKEDLEKTQGSSQEMDNFLTSINKSAKVDKEESVKPSLTFNNKDSILDMGTNKRSIVSAPKTIERLEAISEMRNERRKAEEEEDEDDEDDDDRLVISDIPVKLDVMSLDGDGIEILE